MVCCSYCDRQQSCHFYPIVNSTKAGGQDWSTLIGSILCHACYNRYRNGGKLQRTTNKPLSDERKRCTYSCCKRPVASSHFYTIEDGKTAGGQDWSILTGHILCHACYKQYLQRGTLVRPLLGKSGTRCTPVPVPKSSASPYRRPSRSHKTKDVDAARPKCRVFVSFPDSTAIKIEIPSDESPRACESGEEDMFDSSGAGLPTVQSYAQPIVGLWPATKADFRTPAPLVKDEEQLDLEKLLDVFSLPVHNMFNGHIDSNDIFDHASDEIFETVMDWTNVRVV